MNYDNYGSVVIRVLEVVISYTMNVWLVQKLVIQYWNTAFKINIFDLKKKLYEEFFITHRVFKIIVD